MFWRWESDFNFNDYKNYLLNNKIILKSQQTFKSKALNEVKHYTQEISNILLSSNDDKRLQTYPFDIITTYPYRANAFKVG